MSFPFPSFSAAFGLFLLFLLQATGTTAQNIKEKFDKLSVSENFDSVSTYWTTMANSENLFIVQDGEYILQRKSTTAPYAIIAGLEESFSNFRVVTSIKLDKSLGEDAYAGFMFMIQPQGAGGFLVEINKRKEYRIRQIVDGSYKYLTGSSKDGGWIRNNAVQEANFSNMIELRVFNKNYDLFINNTFLMSFAEPVYKNGSMGLLIGPSTRAKVDFLYVFTIASEAETASSGEASANPANPAAPDIIELAESIIKLKTQINVLTEENDELQKTISAMKSGDAERDVTIRNFEKQVKNLQDESARKQKSLDSLKKVNTELEKFREIAGGSENGDLVISLSKALKTEKEKNAALQTEIREMRETYNIPAKPSESKSPKPKGTDQGQKNDSPKNNSTFSLPKEN